MKPARRVALKIRILDTVPDPVLEVVGRIRARADELRPGLRQGFGGPLNGQQRRRELLEDVLAHVPISAIVETGTHRGVTAEYLAKTFRLPVITIEASPRFYHYAKRRLRDTPGVRVLRGDSRDVLRGLSRGRSVPGDLPLFYLDAHSDGAEVPLADEIQVIASGWKEWVILVDDFRVPDDPGYGFDRYVNGVELSLEYVPLSPLGNAGIFWPAAHSSAETGYVRGSVILGSAGRVAETLATLSTLRPA